MEWIEVTGRTLQSAKEVALDRLGVSEDDLDFEVLEESRAGFLGVGRADARIRARVKPLSREKPNERRRRSRSRSRDRRGPDGAQSPGKSSTSTPSARDETGERADTRPPAKKPARSTDRTRGRRTDVPKGEREVTEELMTDDEQREHAERFLAGLVDAFGVDATIDTAFEDERLNATIEGADLGRLIGPSAATLSAIEELTQTVLQHASDGHGPRVRLDVGGYRAERQAALEAFTLELAEQVRSSGQEIALEPMGSTDRKIVHDVIGECDDLETISEGEEPQRRVVIRGVS